MNIFGIGVDICEISRIDELIQRHGQRFVKKVFAGAEIEYCTPKKDKSASFAARFAAKEALLKALGTGMRDGFVWRDIEVVNDQLGKPVFRFYGKTAQVLKDKTVHLSLSHSRENAIAFVVIENLQEKV